MGAVSARDIYLLFIDWTRYLLFSQGCVLQPLVIGILFWTCPPRLNNWFQSAQRQDKVWNAFFLLITSGLTVGLPQQPHLLMTSLFSQITKTEMDSFLLPELDEWLEVSLPQCKRMLSPTCGVLDMCKGKHMSWSSSVLAKVSKCSKMNIQEFDLTLFLAKATCTEMIAGPVLSQVLGSEWLTIQE